MATGVRNPRPLDGDLVQHGLSGKGRHEDVVFRAYVALVRMAQGFIMRYPLVDAQGNVGSADGDPPADHFFTQCRRSVFAETVLDLESGSALIPHLVVNGSARGPAPRISFLPHHLGEICRATVSLLLEPEGEDPAVCGPDFPTGGILESRDAAKSLYVEGRARLGVSARAAVSTQAAGAGGCLVIKELPYLVEKGPWIEGVCALLRAGALEGVCDVGDESSAGQVSIVLTVEKGANWKSVLERMRRNGLLETTFDVEMVDPAIKGGAPVPLRLALETFISHRVADLAKRHRRRCAADLRAMIADELTEIQERFGDPRRTEIPEARPEDRESVS